MNYLSNRSQVTKYNGAVSNSGVVTVGVPQGSILGPLLFIIYLNDMPQVVHCCKVSCYADDTAIYTSGPTVSAIQADLQDDLSRIALWLKGNKLSLNVNKSKVMCFSSQYYRPATDIVLYIDGAQLEQVEQYKYLGMILDNRLNFADHIDRLVKKSRQRIGGIGRVRKYITKDIALILYKAMVVPLFDFGDIIYMFASQDNLA